MPVKHGGLIIDTPSQLVADSKLDTLTEVVSAFDGILG
jgi:hypothetical protein